MPEHEIGEVFYSQVLKKWLKVCENSDQLDLTKGCRKCAFFLLPCWKKEINPGYCFAGSWEDLKHVHFEETEEPQKGGQDARA